MIGLYLLTIIVLLVLWHKIRSYYWTNRNVPGPKPWPVVGNIGPHLFGKKTIGEVIDKIYKKYEGYPFVGIFRATTPCLLVRDPDFVNKIFVKDHKSFYNNDFFIDKNNDPLFGQNPFVLKNKEWKDTRQMLTPGFTSIKMRQMYPIINDVTKRVIKFIDNHPNATTDGIDTRDLTRRFTLDNVAQSAFGIDGKCLENYKGKSEFMVLADKILVPGSLNGILQQLNAVFPYIGQLISIKLVPKNVERELVSIVTKVAKYRLENQVQGNDYFQFLLQLAKEKSLSFKDIAAHGVTFFFDGYESSSNVFTSLLMHLAMNPKYQTKIREEISKTEQEHPEGITFETICEMKWLDACIFESLRVSPFMSILVKQCTQSYEYTPDDPKFKKISVKLYPGDTIILPYGSLMNDERYFRNARAFIPERMMERDAISKSVFFPFGSGPRACIGQRFGLLQLKLGTAMIIKNFEISMSSRTKLPPKLVPFHFLNEIQGSVWLKYKKIH